MEFEAVQNDSGPYEPVARRRTQCRDDEDEFEHDESGPSQPPAMMYRRRWGAEEEARPSNNTRNQSPRLPFHAGEDEDEGVIEFHVH